MRRDSSDRLAKATYCPANPRIHKCGLCRTPSGRPKAFVELEQLREHKRLVHGVLKGVGNMQVHNRTTVTEEYIRQREKVGVIRNEWRGRTVELFQGETDDRLYMIGETFDGTMKVITLEPIGFDEKTAMDYWQHGQRPVVRK